MSDKPDERQLPKYLKDYKGPKLDLSIQVEDLLWIGEDGRLDYDALLKDHGYDPEAPLIAILQSIIDAHPLEGGPSREARLEIALEALTGQPRKRGMDLIDDYDLLLKIASRYFEEFWERRKRREPPPDVAPIIRQVVGGLDDERRLRADDDSLIRRLRKKFNKDKDLLLVRVSLENDWNRPDKLRAINRVIEGMQKLGIQAVRRELRPQVRPPEPKDLL